MGEKSITDTLEKDRNWNCKRQQWKTKQEQKEQGLQTENCNKALIDTNSKYINNYFKGTQSNKPNKKTEILEWIKKQDPNIGSLQNPL